MAGSHPYISGPGNISQMVVHLRKSFPPTVNSDTVKKLGLASNNESYVINALQFIDVINEEGKKTEKAKSVFAAHKDEDFEKAFSALVSDGYSELFELYGDGAWNLSKDELITFFRKADDTSDTIGRRQANTFEVFAALSGHGDIPAKKSSSAAKAKTQTKSTTKKAKPRAKAPLVQENTQTDVINRNASNGDFGLTVRIELSLPADGTKETYDNIFKSIRENLMNE